ncbi:hypothetical protein [Streptomyces sp. 1-11]|uniref:hypothetical protein n=1 Tax=Streptomyces sp. 1-11 TaxID=2590549 RepID=UPI001173A701|nr:hypothetical protein [Streptomyces sp. 1-11]GEK00920.1 hypothetical protein TNCT1_31960 [Streptomyces sp. 1-11]
MPAGHEDGEHGGMDALMAAITGTPLPPRAQEDPALLAEHRSAEADVAVLREQLVRLAEVLTGEPQQPAPGTTPGAGAGATAADGPAGAGACGGAGGVGGGAEGAGTEDAEGAGAEVTSGPVPGAAPAGLRGAGRPRSVRRPGGAGRPGRPGGVRRGARVVLGSMAGVMAFGLVTVLGWAVAHSGGGMSAGSDKSADAKSRADGPARAAGGPALSCYRLLAEGTVTRVDRRTQAPRIRVVLTVTRSYRPAHGPSEVTFLLGDTASPAPRSGQHVLAGVGRGRQEASLWAVGDARVADEKARLTGPAPESEPAPCDEP